MTDGAHNTETRSMEIRVVRPREHGAKSRSRRASGVILIAAVSALVAASCSGSSSSSSPGSSTSTSAGSGPSSSATPGTKRPNIVFILTDDLSWNLINAQFAPHIVQLQKRGMTFDHYFVADSLCCPSRSTIFTGLFPHDTHVQTNMPPNGGFLKFQAEGLDKKTYAVALTSAGYKTALLGKYLNGYGDPMTKKKTPVPPGWSDWHASNATGYAEFNFLMNDNGKFNRYKGKKNYGVDVINSDAQKFINHAGGKPFAIEVATFAPHAPYTPAPRNEKDFPGLQEPRDASFDAGVVNPPAWLAQKKALTPNEIKGIDKSFRKRAQAVEAVDKLLADTEATLAKNHLAGNTYIVFSSDNGYHLGQHRLVQGKQTAFDTDIRVPLIVAGPGVPHGRTVSQVAQNVDLYPTFLDLAGQAPGPRIEGRSLVPLLHPSDAATPWRTVALVEHKGGNIDPADPDFEGGSSNPTSYEAIRISAKHLANFAGPVEAVYVEYLDREKETEYYDIAKDPFELHNIASTLTAAQRSELHEIVSGMEGCHSASACWTAAQPE